MLEYDSESDMSNQVDSSQDKPVTEFETPQVNEE